MRPSLDVPESDPGSIGTTSSTRTFPLASGSVKVQRLMKKVAAHRRAVSAALMLPTVVACQSVTGFTVVADEAISSDLNLVLANGELLTLAVKRPAAVYLREIVIEGELGETILELGDDTGMKDQAFMFVVPGQPAVIAAAARYIELMKTHVAPGETDGDDAVPACVIYFYCLVWTQEWPLQKSAQLSSENIIVYQTIRGDPPVMDPKFIAVPVRQGGWTR